MNIILFSKQTPNSLSLLLLFTLLFFLTACSTNKKPPKESDGEGDKINVQIVVDANSNLNSLGKAAPIRLDLYQLTSNGEFNQADFFELIEKPKESLGDKLIQHDQYMLYPDSVTVLPMQLDSNLKYLGVVGSYRKLNDTQWRLILFKQNKRWYHFGGNYLYIHVDENGLKQLSSDEMQEKLKAYQERHPEDERIRGGKAYSEKVNLDKGVFREVGGIH